MFCPGFLLNLQEFLSTAPRYIVLAGRLQVESPDGLLLRYAGPGEVLSLENSLVLRAVRGKLAGGEKGGKNGDGTRNMVLKERGS